MVGVAGKSKGCNTCRRRKKGCDLQRPSCGQCIKSGLVCGGYQRDLTFVTEDPERRMRGAGDKSVKRPTPAPREPEWDSLYASALTAISRRGGPDLVHLPKSCMRTAFESQAAGLFWDMYIPRERFWSKDLRVQTWLQLVLGLSDKEPALRLSFTALTSCRLGTDANDTRLVQESSKVYSMALWELQRALWDEDKMYKNETLSACMVLSLYEVMQGSARRGWGYISHTSGANRLIQLRGPERHISGASFDLFRGQRLNGVITGITTRKANFLIDPQWLTIPWLEHERDLRDRLLDVMVELPMLTQRHDTIDPERQDADSNARRIALVHYCYTLEMRLQQWYDLAKSSFPNGAIYWVIQSPIEETDGPPPPPRFPFKEYSFPDHYTGQNMAFYWAALVLLYGTMHSLCRNLRLSPSIDTMISPALPAVKAPPAPHTDPYIYATHIASSIEYFLDPDMRALGPNLLSFPLGVASFYFRYHTVRPGEVQVGEAPANPGLAFFSTKFRKMKMMGFSTGAFLSSLLEDTAGITIPRR